jgi:hypothetical protein
MKNSVPRSPSSTDDEVVEIAYEIYLRLGQPANLTFRQWLEAEARELGLGIDWAAIAAPGTERSADERERATGLHRSETKLHPRRVEFRT